MFGPLVTGTDVRKAVQSTVKAWIRDYLGEVARASGRASEDLKPFRSYVSSIDLDKWEGEQYPSCVTVAPGLLEAPEMSRQTYSARWGVGVAAVVVGQNRDNTFELTELYTAALRSLLVQHQSLGGFAEELEWLGERYDELQSTDLRTIGAGTVQLSVGVTSAQSRYGGPSHPTVPADPVTDPGDVPTVGSVSVTTTRKG